MIRAPKKGKLVPGRCAAENGIAVGETSETVDDGPVPQREVEIELIAESGIELDRARLIGCGLGMLKWHIEKRALLRRKL